MSQLKVNTIRHTSGTADNITLDNSQNVTVEGQATVDAGLKIGSANQTKTVDGVLIERNSSDGMAHITAGRSGGNFSGLYTYVAGGDGVTKKFTIDNDGTYKFFAQDGSTERVRIDSTGQLVTSTSYTGGFTSSSGTSPVGLYLGISGATNQQVSCNSYGYECNVINNISGSGHSAGVHQYRTLNSTEGTLQGDSSGLSISNNSDYRKKERITDLTGSLEVIDSLRPRQYYYRAGFGKPTRAFAGFIAHEVQSTDLPQLTTGVKDAVVTQADKDNGLYNCDDVGDPIYQTVAYSHNELITHLVNAVKELKAKVAALEAG